MTFTLFEHTADVGIHVEAKDLNVLFADAASGLFAIIVEIQSEKTSMRTISIGLEGHRLDYLLLDWLSELLMQFELQKLVLSGFEIKLDGLVLAGKANAEPLDHSRHRLLHEVKAITYHGLNVTQTKNGWSADVIVDI